MAAKQSASADKYATTFSYIWWTLQIEMHYYIDVEHGFYVDEKHRSSNLKTQEPIDSINAFVFI